jgi:hypothetical protein
MAQIPSPWRAGRVTDDADRPQWRLHFSLMKEKGGGRGWAILGQKAERSGLVPWKKSVATRRLRAEV